MVQRKWGVDPEGDGDPATSAQPAMIRSAMAVA